MSVSDRSEAGGLQILPSLKYYDVLKLSIFNVPLAPLQGGGEIDIYTHALFCTKLNPEQLLFEAVFDVMRTSGSVES